jgi:hypothetical protein
VSLVNVFIVSTTPLEQLVTYALLVSMVMQFFSKTAKHVFVINWEHLIVTVFLEFVNVYQTLKEKNVTVALLITTISNLVLVVCLVNVE